jgi:acetamidase/formamidase
MTRHRLDPSPSTTVDVFSRDLPPVLTVDPGDAIMLRSLNASGHLQPQTFAGEKVPAMGSKRRSGHCLTGPIAVRGAVPGQVLAVRFISLRPDTWGYTVAARRDTPLARRLGLHEGPPAWLLWQVDADARLATSDRGHTVRIAPFHGVTGVARDEQGEPVRALVRLGLAAAHPGEHRQRPVTLPRAGQFYLQDDARRDRAGVVVEHRHRCGPIGHGCDGTGGAPWSSSTNWPR